MWRPQNSSTCAQQLDMSLTPYHHTSALPLALTQPLHTHVTADSSPARPHALIHPRTHLVPATHNRSKNGALCMRAAAMRASELVSGGAHCFSLRTIRRPARQRFNVCVQCIDYDASGTATTVACASGMAVALQWFALFYQVGVAIVVAAAVSIHATQHMTKWM